MKRRDWVWAVGLGVAAVLIGTAYVYGQRFQLPAAKALAHTGLDYPMWVFDPTAQLGPLAVVGAAAAFRFGLKCSRSASAARRLAAAFFGVLCFGVLLAAPAGGRWGLLLRKSYTLPVMPEALGVRHQADPFDSDGHPHYAVGFLVSADRLTVGRYYKEEFAVRKWAAHGYTIPGVSAFDEKRPAESIESITFGPGDPYGIADDVEESATGNDPGVDVAIFDDKPGYLWAEVQKIDPLVDPWSSSITGWGCFGGFAP
jgi:hypothetical protein